MRCSKIALLFLILSLFVLPKLSAQTLDESKLVEFSSILDTLVSNVIEIDNCYSTKLTEKLAQNKRQTVFDRILSEAESLLSSPKTSTAASITKLERLVEKAKQADFSKDETRFIFEELCVQSAVFQCQTNGIKSDIMVQHIKGATARFVADRGNFFHPDFDSSKLSIRDLVQIYFAGFGLAVLFEMPDGIQKAKNLYTDSIELKPYFAQQIVSRAVDLDMAGIELIRLVMFDTAINPFGKEMLYSLIAEKILRICYDQEPERPLSNDWKSTVADWAMKHVTVPERLSARGKLPLYGANLDSANLSPEAVLGLVGPIGAKHVKSLLSSKETINKICGLEAARWINSQLFPEYAAEIYAIAEPLMAHDDFAVAVLALNIFEEDAVRQNSESYDEKKRARLKANLPNMCKLMNKVLESGIISYLDTTAWFDIYAEGSLVDGLKDCMPMIVRIINVDWNQRTTDENFPLPERELILLSHFMPAHPEYFKQTSDSVLGFLNHELDRNSINSNRAWAYVQYLEAAESASAKLDENWISALQRLKTWAVKTPVLSDKEALVSKIENLL